MVALSQVEHNMALATEAVEQIGMGRYQWQMFVSCSFGFFADQMLLVSVALVMPQIEKEFNGMRPTMLTLALYVGMCVGAALCGPLVDVLGRRLVFNISLFLVSVWTLVCAGAPNYYGLAAFIALQGVAGGGNVAIDLTILYECLPQRNTWIMTLLGFSWGIGNAVGGLIAWPLITAFSCLSTASPNACQKSENMGWRYQYIVIGALCFIMALLRAFYLRAEESPRWLITQGRYEEAVASIKRIALVNKTDYTISVSDFDTESADMQDRLQAQSDNLRFGPLRRLFRGKKLAISTTSVAILWIAIGIAYPLYSLFLPYYLQSRSTNLGDGSTYQTYRDYAISSAVGIFGPCLSSLFVKQRYIGRRGALAITAFCTAAFAGAYTAVKSEASNLAISSMINFWQYAFYAVLYAYTAEVFPTHDRGTGCGLSFSLGKAASLSAPLIATYGGVTTSTPIWVCLALYVAIGGVSLVLPFEPRHFNNPI